MSQEDKPVAEVLSTQVEAWQREVSALQEKIAFAIGKPVAAQEPETESFVQTVPDHCDRIVWKGTYIHLPIANAAPCARCTELEEQIRKSALDSLSAERQSDEEIEELQAKITEQAALISELEARETILVRSNSSLNIQRAENDSLKEVISLSEDSRLMDEYLKLERANARQAERIKERAARIKALEAEAADRESFLKTLANTCTDAERIAIERAGRIDVLESECRKLRARLEKAEPIVAAARNLIEQKGRHNTEIAYKRLADAIAKERTT